MKVWKKHVGKEALLFFDKIKLYSTIIKKVIK